MRVSNKDKYINNAINRFSGNARDILLKQIELFYDVDNQVTKNRYNIGDDVKGNIYSWYFWRIRKF